MIATPYQPLLQSIATTVADYRAGEIAPIDPDHVERWIHQFDEEDRLVILQEMDRILQRYYLSRQKAIQLLEELLDTKDLFGDYPAQIIRTSHFLNIQGGGQSQRKTLELLNQLTVGRYNTSVFERPVNLVRYFYLDDILFSGNRVLNDIRDWLPQALPNTDLHLVFNVIHEQGLRYVVNKLNPLVKEKGIRIQFWQDFPAIQNDSNGNAYECFWPMECSGDDFVNTYIKEVRRRAEEKNWPTRIFRPERRYFKETVFSSAEARHRIEQAFLRKGAYLVSLAENPNAHMRPMGFEVLETLGFGALVVTYRNIANNCPLVLWWGNPAMREDNPLSQWYPLFPRRTYEEAHGFSRLILR